MTLEIGDAAPIFEIENENDELVCLPDLKGKNVILYFYPKDNTPGCTIEAQDFNKKIKEFDKLDCVILGVSRDSIKSHCNFIAKYDLGFHLLCDKDEVLCRDYDVIKEKSTFGKKYMGIERSTFLIDKIGKIAKIWRKVKVKGHVEEVLEAAKGL